MKILQLVQSNGKPQVVRLGITVGLAMLFLTALLCASASSAPTIASPSVAQEATALNNGSVITIGVAAGLSGPIPDLGWRQTNAVQLAISQTNAAGGVDIGGVAYTVTMVIADSACDATQAVTAANTLLDAGAVAVVGHTCSGASVAAQPLYNAADVAMVSASSTWPGLTEQGYTTTFRVIGKDGPEAVFMATYFRQWLGVDEVTIIERSGSWGDIATTAFSDTFVSLEGTITNLHVVNSTDDYTATLTAIQAENPDAIYYADENANNAGLLSSIAHDLGMSDMIIGWDAVSDNFDAYATAAGPAAEGDYAVSFMPSSDDMPGYGAFNAAYQAAGFPNYGDEAQMWGAFAYDAARIIIAAIDRADGTDPTAIRDEIGATVDYEGAAGTYGGFDAKGDISPQWMWLKRYESGQWVMLHPSRVFLPLTLKSYSPGAGHHSYTDSTTSATPSSNPSGYIYTGYNPPYATPRSIEIYWPLSSDIVSSTAGMSTFEFWGKGFDNDVTHLYVNGHDVGAVEVGTKYGWSSASFHTGYLDQGDNNVIEIWTSSGYTNVACDAPENDDVGQPNKFYIRNNGGTIPDHGPRYGGIYAQLTVEWYEPWVCAPYYEADFDGSTCDWPEPPDLPHLSAGCVNGKYQIFIKQPYKNGFVVASTLPVSDFTLATDVQFATNNGGAAGLTFGNRTTDEFYNFLIQPDSGVFGLYKQNGEVLIGWQSNAAINTYPATNRLKVERESSTIWLYANGHLLDTLDDSSIHTTSIGVYSESDALSNVDTRYDNFVAYPLNCGSMAVGAAP